ncbi:MAG: CDGSH iron-sulfur domain-containing protein [Burkholderiales bacterium]
MPEDKRRRYESGKVAVTWDAARCIHAAECVRGLPEVFDPQAKPWIRPDAADPASVADVVNRCPTGALSMRHADESSAMVVPPLNTGHVTPDGPNYLRGQLTLRHGETVVEDTRIALCRCGASGNKPYCDGSHRKAGFKSDGTLPAEVPARPGTDLSAPLTIKPIPNGPIQCAGPLALRDSAGRTAFSDQTFLCRCGHSQNKPYCDGTHRKIGFTA